MRPVLREPDNAFLVYHDLVCPGHSLGCQGNLVLGYDPRAGVEFAYVLRLMAAEPNVAIWIPGSVMKSKQRLRQLIFCYNHTGCLSSRAGERAYWSVLRLRPPDSSQELYYRVVI